VTIVCRNSGIRARPFDAMAGPEGKEGAGTAALHKYTFYAPCPNHIIL